MKLNIALVEIEKGPAPEEANLRLLVPDHIDDGALWNSFRSGDEKALVAIFDRNVTPLCKYGQKIIPDLDVVKDSVQELFIELWSNRKNLGETTSIKFYLYTCIRRKLFRLKSKHASKMQVELSAEYPSQISPSIEFVLVEEQSSIEKRQFVMHLLDTLTKRQREAIFLRYIEEMEYEEIAGVMELNKQVVYNLIHKAIASLRSNLKIFSSSLLLFASFP